MSSTNDPHHIFDGNANTFQTWWRWLRSQCTQAQLVSLDAGSKKLALDKLLESDGQVLVDSATDMTSSGAREVLRLSRDISLQ